MNERVLYFKSLFCRKEMNLPGDQTESKDRAPKKKKK